MGVLPSQPPRSEAPSITTCTAWLLKPFPSKAQIDRSPIGANYQQSLKTTEPNNCPIVQSFGGTFASLKTSMFDPYKIQSHSESWLTLIYSNILY